MKTNKTTSTELIFLTFTRITMTFRFTRMTIMLTFTRIITTLRTVATTAHFLYLLFEYELYYSMF